jgi:hypothetical protein
MTVFIMATLSHTASHFFKNMAGHEYSVPFFLSLRIKLKKASLIRGSNPVVGSSKTRMFFFPLKRPL